MAQVNEGLLRALFFFALGVIRSVARYLRLIFTIVITVVAAFLGFQLRPQAYAIPYSTVSSPYLNVSATIPNVKVDVSSAWLDQTSLVLQMNAKAPAGYGTVALYVELSNVQPGWEFDQRILGSDNWSTQSEGDGDGYSVGHSYILERGHSYSIPVVIDFGDCQCYIISGPYVAVSPLDVNPQDLTSSQLDSDGVSANDFGQALMVTPGETSGRHYLTTLKSIDQDVVNLNGLLPSGASVVVSAPKSPSNLGIGAWFWRDATYSRATFLDPGKQNNINNETFYGGIFLGVAGGGALALIPETASVIEDARKRRKAHPKSMARATLNGAKPSALAVQLDAKKASAEVVGRTPAAFRSGGGIWAFFGGLLGILAAWTLARKLRR